MQVLNTGTAWLSSLASGQVGDRRTEPRLRAVDTPLRHTSSLTLPLLPVLLCPLLSLHSHNPYLYNLPWLPFYLPCKYLLVPWASLIAQLIKNLVQGRRPQFDSWVGKIPWRRKRLRTPVFLGFPYGSAGKESTCSVGDLGLIPGLGRSPGEGKGYHSSIPAWRIPWTVVHGVSKSQTWLIDFHFHFLFKVLPT